MKPREGIDGEQKREVLEIARLAASSHLAERKDYQLNKMNDDDFLDVFEETWKILSGETKLDIPTMLSAPGLFLQRLMREAFARVQKKLTAITHDEVPIDSFRSIGSNHSVCSNIEVRIVSSVGTEQLTRLMALANYPGVEVSVQRGITEGGVMVTVTVPYHQLRKFLLANGVVAMERAGMARATATVMEG